MLTQLRRKLFPILAIVATIAAISFGPDMARADDQSELFAAFAAAKKLQLKADYPAAAKYYERALALAPRVFGPNAENTGAILNNLAALYDDMGQYAKAEPLYLRALKIKVAINGPNSPEAAGTVNNLATLYYNMGQNGKAEQYYLRSLKIKEATLPADHIHIAISLNNLATLYKELDQFAKAEPLFLRTIKIYEAKLGPDHPDLADTLNNLANLYDTRGQHAQAEPLYLRALKIRQAVLEPDHPKIAGSLNNLALIYENLGQYAKAQPLLEKALKIYEAKNGPDHPLVGTALNNLAGLYDTLDQPEKAEEYYLRSMKIREATVGSDHPDVAASLNNLAGLYRDREEYPRAEEFYLRCMKIQEASLGPNHRVVGTTLNNLAILYRMMGKHADAKSLYERSLKIRENVLGPDHADVAETLGNMAVLDVAVGEPGQAAEAIERARKIVRKFVAQVLPALSEKEQLKFLEVFDHKDLCIALSLPLHRPGDKAITELSAGWLANGKAVAQATLAERAQLARNLKDPKLAQTAANLQAVRTELAALASTEAAPGQEAARQAQLARLTGAEQSLAKEIAAARGQAAPDQPWIAMDAIRKALPEGAVLVDIARFDILKFAEAKGADGGEPVESDWLGQHYVAWITPAAGAGDIQLVNLGPAAKIDAAIAAYQKAIVAAQSGETLRDLGEVEATAAVGRPLAELAKLVLEPLVRHVDDAKQLVLSPDAGLWLVPWAALPAGEGKLAIERWQLRYVVAGREVALEKLRSNSGSKLGAPRIFANPDYDLPPREAQAEYAAIFNQGRPAAGRPFNPQGGQLLAMRSAIDLGRVGNLPGTAAEAASVAPKLKEYAQAEPKSYLARQAQEGVFKRLSSPQVLLVSTHGFFLPSQEVKMAEGAELAATNEKNAGADAAGQPLENPLLRCGLLLAGCNQRHLVGRGFDDGVLTGLEIVGANLRGTELVVLSACETGLGQVNNGEGVAGLRQAFQLAGARSVVSTLWQIPDKESAQLMTDFFTNLADGQTKAEALRNAQLSIIKTRRERNHAAHPLFWAAWTVTGD